MLSGYSTVWLSKAVSSDRSQVFGVIYVWCWFPREAQRWSLASQSNQPNVSSHCYSLTSFFNCQFSMLALSGTGEAMGHRVQFGNSRWISESQSKSSVSFLSHLPCLIKVLGRASIKICFTLSRANTPPRKWHLFNLQSWEARSATNRSKYKRPNDSLGNYWKAVPPLKAQVAGSLSQRHKPPYKKRQLESGIGWSMKTKPKNHSGS